MPVYQLHIPEKTLSELDLVVLLRRVNKAIGLNSRGMVQKKYREEMIEETEAVVMAVLRELAVQKEEKKKIA